MAFKRIFLDIGHGENNGANGQFDPGAAAVGYTEYGIIKEVVRKIVTEIKPDFVELIIVPELSRTNVARYANSMHEEGDALVSLHMNASASGLAYGVEVIIASHSNERHIQANRLGRGVTRILGTRFRRVMLDADSPRGYLTVLRNTIAPAFMLELGFITNTRDREAVLERGAEAVVEGLRLLAKGDA